MSARIGSLFSGYGGLDIAAAQLFGATVAWHVEYDTAPSKILAHHWPDVPNYGDITTVDWSAVEPIDILTGGSPCQDLSAAGKRAGMTDGTRSNLWVNMREAIRQLQPRYVLWENVLGALSAPAASASDMVPDAGPLGNPGDGHLRALGRVLGDLTEIGYDARWTTVRASDVGAPHHRARIFLLATPADTEGVRRDHGAPANVWATDREVDTPGDDHDIAAERSSAMPADTDGIRWRQGPQQPSSGAQEVPATVSDIGALPRDGRTDDLLTDRWGVPLCQTCSDALRNRRGSWECPDPNVCGNQNDPFPPDDWYDENDRLVLPTPMAQHSGNTPENHLRKKPGRKRVTDLAILVENNLLDTGGVVLPTPRAHQRGDCPSEQERKSPDLGSVGYHFTPERWGKYAPAIHRWEQVTRRAPAPTEPNRNGRPRLAAAFAEWMMGLPAGWVTDVVLPMADPRPNRISRTDALKAIGNGVCPQQAYAAGRELLAMTITDTGGNCGTH